MPLPLPNLDDRRWADLVEEGRALIPIHAPEWTDHNIHDPGITLMELFAWVAEMDIYQLNRIPDRHKRKFLALVGVVPELPQPARTMLRFNLASNSNVLRLPETVEFEGTDKFGVATRFRTLAPIHIAPGFLKAIQLKDQKGFHDFTDRWVRGEDFAVFGAEPQPGMELYFGFSEALLQEEFVNLFFSFAHRRSSEAERRRLIDESNAHQRACRPPLSDFPCPNVAPLPPPVEAKIKQTPLHHGVRLVWEILVAADGEPSWESLKPDHIDDETRALTLDGRVRLSLPSQMAKKKLGQMINDLYYLRVRFVAGRYDASPFLHRLALNGIIAEQAVSVGEIKNIDSETIEAVLLGSSDGSPNQKWALPEAPVHVPSFQLYTREEDKWRVWRRRSDFDESTRSASDFLLDPTDGVITFSDGEKGRVPPKDAQIYAIYYATQAEAGNLSAGTINRLADSPHNRRILGSDYQKIKERLAVITNPIAAIGGASAETLTHAIGRAIEQREKTQRAVTLQDYETLALQTPGAQLARVKAWANLHPSFPCLKAQGLITVIILPYLPLEKPMPSVGLRRTVATYLNRRRIIGTRVEVVGPTYLEISVHVKVQAYVSVNKAALQQKIIETLNNFLHPLKGGSKGTGWPFGRDVYRTEVMQVIDALSGVDHIFSLELIANENEPQCGNVCLNPIMLVTAGPHEVEAI